MVWIESHLSLGSHPKTFKLARLLGISRAAAVGHLHYLWWWAMDYAPSGSLDRFDPIEIAIAGAWEGLPAEFIESLTQAGFLDVDGTIHDWMDYAGRLVLLRQRKAEAMRKKRATTLPARSGDVPLPTVPNRTQPNHTQQNLSSAEEAPTSQFPEWFNILAQDPRWKSEGPERYITSVEKAHPNVDLDLEAHAAYEWLQTAKGLKKKVLRGFWTNWLTPSKNGTAASGQPSSPMTHDDRHEAINVMARAAMAKQEERRAEAKLPKTNGDSLPE